MREETLIEELRRAGLKVLRLDVSGSKEVAKKPSIQASLVDVKRPILGKVIIF